jgi:hypothetical protein
VPFVRHAKVKDPDPDPVPGSVPDPFPYVFVPPDRLVSSTDADPGPDSSLFS